MLRFHDSRWVHYLVVGLVAALLSLPSLGMSGLWDIDEGLNAEAAREMLESGNWIVPKFNYMPRTAKPALLYWLQATSYQHLGVNEYAARLPSALASILVALVTCELGRRMFDPRAGLYAGLIVASSLQFSVLAHAATPDMLLLLGVVVALALFWHGYTYNGSLWLITCALGTGLAVLAKGPAGLALPLMIIILFLLSRGQIRLYFNWRLGLGILLFAAIALPWYILVGSETRGEFLRGFWWKENVGRFLEPLEQHAGPIYFYPLVFIVGYAPWCVFIVPTLTNGCREARGDDERSRLACRLLLIWASTYFLFFSAAATKLPNYILPSYPALALLTARMLRRWRAGEKVAAVWVMPACLLSLGLVGAIAATSLVLASGDVRLAALKANAIPGLDRWAPIGLIPVIGGIIAWWLSRSGFRGRAMATVTVASIVFLGLLMTFPIHIIDGRKAPKELVATAGLCQPDKEIRIAALDYFQPSLVFYARREVKQLRDEQAALEFLESPMTGYLICPAKAWDELSAKAPAQYSVLARKHDLYRNYEVVVVVNR